MMTAAYLMSTLLTQHHSLRFLAPPPRGSSGGLLALGNVLAASVGARRSPGSRVVALDRCNWLSCTVTSLAPAFERVAMAIRLESATCLMVDENSLLASSLGSAFGVELSLRTGIVVVTGGLG